MPLLRCDNITLAYESHIAAEKISFCLEKGDYLCILGENGSGKSTLMKGILGLKRYNGGSVTFGDGLRQSEIGYLPQQTTLQKDFPASVQEVVLSGCLQQRGMLPFYGEKEKTLALAQMERLEVANLKDACYRDLSGGQQRRVLLARALCAAKKLLVLDEPTAGLDPAVTGQMYEVIQSLNQEGLTVLMVSHDMQGAARYASHILHMNRRLLFFGTKEDYLQSPLGKAYTGGECGCCKP